MPDPPSAKFKQKPIPIHIALIKCPEIQAFPALLIAQASYGGVRVPVSHTDFVDCVKFVHALKNPKPEPCIVDTSASSTSGDIPYGRKGKWAPPKAKGPLKEDKKVDPAVLEAAERLLDKVSEATTKAPAKEYDDEFDEPSKGPGVANLDTTLIRELETIKASVTRAVDQMDKKLGLSMETIKDTIANSAVDTITEYLRLGMEETRSALASTMSDVLKERGLPSTSESVVDTVRGVVSAVDSLSEAVKAVGTGIVGISAEVKTLRADMEDLRDTSLRVWAAAPAAHKPHPRDAEKDGEPVEQTDSSSTAPALAQGSASVADQQIFKNQLTRALEAIHRVENVAIEVRTACSNQSKSIGKVNDKLHSTRDILVNQQEKTISLLQKPTMLSSFTKENAKESTTALDKIKSLQSDMKTNLSSVETAVKAHSVVLQNVLQSKVAGLERSINHVLSAFDERTAAASSKTSVADRTIKTLTTTTATTVEELVALKSSTDKKFIRLEAVLLTKLALLESRIEAIAKKSGETSTLNSPALSHLLKEYKTSTNAEIFKIQVAIIEAVRSAAKPLPQLESAIIASDARADELKRLLEGLHTRFHVLNGRLSFLENMGQGADQLVTSSILFYHVEDLKRCLTSGGLASQPNNPSLRELCIAQGQILTRVELNLSDLRTLVKAVSARPHPQTTSSGELTNTSVQNMLQVSVGDLKRHLTTMSNTSAATSLKALLDPVDTKVAACHALIGKLEPRFAVVDSMAEIVAQFGPSFGKFDQLKNLQELKKIEEVLKRCSAQDAQLSKTATTLDNTRTRLERAGTKLERIAELAAAADSDRQAKHETASLEPLQTNLEKSFSDKTNQIIKTLRGIEKRVYNSEVRLFDLKAPLKDAVSKIEAADSKTEKIVSAIGALQKLLDNKNDASSTALDNDSLREWLDSKVGKPVADINLLLQETAIAVVNLPAAVREAGPAMDIQRELLKIETEVQDMKEHGDKQRSTPPEALDLILKTVCALQDMAVDSRSLLRRIVDSPKQNAPASPSKKERGTPPTVNEKAQLVDTWRNDEKVPASSSNGKHAIDPNNGFDTPSAEVKGRFI